MAFIAEELAVEICGRLRGICEIVLKRDRDLGNQIRRAATSVALNISEGKRRVGGDQTHCYRIASGSASEVRTGLKVAVGWGYLDPGRVVEVDAILDRLGGMLWSLSQPR